ncbi:MAG: nucleotidyltransferase family protein [Planctomycetes bacterium]|nr:nucleotidyltransferase family protein [Planctomycetota bacterium]
MLNRLLDVFKSFQRHEVRYVILGGVASVLYGVPRTTFDLDLLIEATPENAERLLTALREAGFASATLTDAVEVVAHEITIFNDRVRIDVQTWTPGLSFPDAWQRRKTVTFEGQDFFLVSREDLIASKRAAGRPVDLDDVRLLELPDEENPVT